MPPALLYQFRKFIKFDGRAASPGRCRQLHDTLHMTQQNDTYVKILFRFYSDVLDEWTVETMWAQTIDSAKGHYKLDSIPFYASVASGDIVFAEYDETEQMLTYKETIEYSGNSTVQVVIMDKNVATNEIRDMFNALGCLSEKFKEGYFVIEIPADKDYRFIKQLLSDLQDKGVIDYAEPSLSDKHWY